MIPYGRQTVDEDDIAAVIAVLRSDFLTQGSQVPKFENALAEYCGVSHAVAVNSATSALHIACMALGVGPGDIVWTSPNTFVASANCARYCGASVDFVDIDPISLNMSVNVLAAKLASAEKAGLLPKVIIPVHFAGLPCEMRSIHALADRYGASIIEDASHALGARYEDTVIGDCAYSDVTVFSFHPVKLITTAEGGAAMTNSATLARQMELLRSHGVTRVSDELESQNVGAWYYEQTRLGFNYRMTELQAALGSSQLSKLDCWVDRRHAIRERYDVAFADLPIILPTRVNSSRSSLHLYPIQVENRRRVFERLRAAGIGVNVHYIPVHTQPDFREFGFRRGDFPNSENYYDKALSLPMFPALSEEEIDTVIEAVRDAVTSTS